MLKEAWRACYYARDPTAADAAEDEAIIVTNVVAREQAESLHVALTYLGDDHIRDRECERI